MLNESLRNQIHAALTKEGLLAWLKTQPAETKFSYYNNEDCLMVRYCKAQGFPVIAAGGDYVRTGFSGYETHISMPDDLANSLHSGINTYGDQIKAMGG